jgi:hypothetical protein
MPLGESASGPSAFLEPGCAVFRNKGELVVVGVPIDFALGGVIATVLDQARDFGCDLAVDGMSAGGFLIGSHAEGISIDERCSDRAVAVPVATKAFMHCLSGCVGRFWLRLGMEAPLGIGILWYETASGKPANQGRKAQRTPKVRSYNPNKCQIASVEDYPTFGARRRKECLSDFGAAEDEVRCRDVLSMAALRMS